MSESRFLILDFGSQLTQLIARRLREIGVFSEIHPFDYSLEKIQAFRPKGIILSGGPSSVYEKESPQRNVSELLRVAPLLGICYGMQLIAKELGGEVTPSSTREYGANVVRWDESFGSLPQLQKVWMSHGDVVKNPPPGFVINARSESGHAAAMKSNRVWAVQFHPEVAHTEQGSEILKSFVLDLCQAETDWNPPHIVKELIEKAQTQVPPSEHVLCALSGGVDSSVVAALLTKALGKDRVHCVFVNNGLLRKNEYDSVLENYKQLDLNIRGVDAQADFLKALKGLTDPEAKRKAIGKTFIDVFEKVTSEDLKKHNICWLAQGTLYPDVIESFSSKGGPSQTIKSHHNVGGLPEKMKLKLIEPVRELFKDEVRKIGKELGLSDQLLGRHPFPGPGLSIRIIGEVNETSLKLVREADAIFINHLRDHGLYDKIWQAFCVLLPVRTVGVQGDGRTYEQVLALRAITSQDGMTADWFPFEFEFLRDVSNQITNQVRGISRVVYDVTSKPPATIEWE
ncbi:MAG: glutamine-hydrolyzing GMP synthase [Proteobacteria bacterium]|jgi:GMP synthase (glutamine-hydrolysing)|nr:glutamine-hydrolyzing GMP synthase [Pseudomonadota bacterium]